MTSSGWRPQDRTIRALVDDAGRESVRRVTRRSTGWWRTETPHGRTRATAIADLVATIARLTQRIEGAGDHGVPPAPPRDDVLADQLAVVTYDLGLALGDATDDQASTALAAYLAVTYEVDPRPVRGDVLDAALAGEAGAFRDVLERLPRAR